MAIQTKRIYAPPAAADGYRILVDRIWPRGVSKAAAALDEWQRECAPSTGLRRWFGHDRAKWAEFKQRYFEELERKHDILTAIRERAAGQTVTLLFAAADEECNNATALMEYITMQL